MHVLIPFAATPDPACREAFSRLKLPHLDALLQRLRPSPVSSWDENSLSPPHEHIQAQQLGLPDDDGLIPFAALAALELSAPNADSISAESSGPDRQQAWAFVTPCHWVLGQDRVSMADPGDLQLSPEHSQRLLQAMRPYFSEDGIELLPYRADTWLARAELFSDLATASLDRVSGRDIGDWLPRTAQARTIRRLQSEMQMLLYNDPVHAEREAQGLQPVNSFWVSGCGRLPDRYEPPAADLLIVDSLRSAALAGDAERYTSAWRDLDSSRLANLYSELGKENPVSLTLCGARSSIRCTGPARSSVARWLDLLRHRPARRLLESL